MKICFLLISHWSGNLGGAELQVKYIIDRLKKDPDYQIYYICRKTKLKEDDGINISKIKYNKTIGKHSHAIDYKQINAYLNKIKPDIIYTRVASAYVGIASAYCRKNSCKLVYHIALQEDVEKYNASGVKFFLNYIDRQIYEYGLKHADAIIGQAQYQDELLRKNYHRSCTEIIPNFHPFPTRVIKKETSSTKIYWIANLKEKKQPEKFISLAKKFLSNQRIEFIMIGAIHSSYWEQQLPIALQETSNLTYKGYLPVERVNEELEKAHIFVNTSLSEGFPNTFVQAWMRKVPVVSLIVNPDNIITQNKLGFVSGSIDQMVEDILQLINNDQLRTNIGKQARDYANKNYSLDNSRKVIDIFHKLYDANTCISS